MFERFTERARQVVVLAQEEARILKHNYIGTEHILLGLLREEEGLAARVLESLDITVERVRSQVTALAAKCRERNILFDFRPKVHTPLMDSYYTPGTKLDGRCLYPFLHARVSFSGKVYFCPFIRVEVGDLTQSTLEEVWNGERYVGMRKKLLEHGIFPVCRRCCKVELSQVPAVATADLPKRRAIPLTVVHG